MLSCWRKKKEKKEKSSHLPTSHWKQWWHWIGGQSSRGGGAGWWGWCMGGSSWAMLSWASSKVTLYLVTPEKAVASSHSDILFGLMWTLNDTTGFTSLSKLFYLLEWVYLLVELSHSHVALAYTMKIIHVLLVVFQLLNVCCLTDDALLKAITTFYQSHCMSCFLG